MTLDMVEIITEKAESILFGMDDNSSSGFFIKDITGLDPVRAEIVSSNFGTIDGAQYQSARRETRNIVIKIGFDPDYLTSSVRGLRLGLYSKLMPKAPIRLRFHMDDGMVAEIQGRVESFEAPLFIRDPEASISIICFNPDFTDINKTTINGASVSDGAEIVIDYSGNIDTGFLFKLNLDRDLQSLSIYHHGPENLFHFIEYEGVLLSGDILEISTVSGSKGMWQNRGGVKTSILYYMSPISSWLRLSPGMNYIRAYTAGVGIPYTIEYTNKYGGL